jgi:hypothetical protein
MNYSEEVEKKVEKRIKISKSSKISI